MRRLSPPARRTITTACSCCCATPPTPLRVLLPHLSPWQQQQQHRHLWPLSPQQHKTFVTTTAAAAAVARPLSSRRPPTTTPRPRLRSPSLVTSTSALAHSSLSSYSAAAAEEARVALASAGFDRASLPLRLPFIFDTGCALFAKRAPRPFPPPFLSPPSGSFSDPLSTHHRSRDRRRRPHLLRERAGAAQLADGSGNLILGCTNGDDAVFASDWFVCANDGVGAWSAKPRGHAGLWARLILHYWATAIFEDAARQGPAYRPDPVAYLQRAYEQTVEATGPPNDWQGTTTAAGAQLFYRRVGGDDNPDNKTSSEGSEKREAEKGGERVTPLLYVTNLGDSQVMVIRPAARALVFKSAEQWHWFDCPRQLGTNSPDTPAANAVVDAVDIREGDVVLAMSDGVSDNLWAHEVVALVSDVVARWRAGGERDDGDAGMALVAEELVEAARKIAMDPFAESPFMERAIEEGLASEGGKLDDISVVAALCRRNDH